MQVSRIFNLPAVLLNLVLVVIMAATLQTQIFHSIAIAVTVLLAAIVLGSLAARLLFRKRVSARLILSLIGTALLWIPVYDAPGAGESTILSRIIDASLVLGCLLLVGSVIWPRRDEPTW